MRKFLAAAMCLLLASCAGEVAFAQVQFPSGAPPVGAPAPVPNGQGGTDYPKPVAVAAPPAQPNGCNYAGSAQCPEFVNNGSYNYAHISTSTTTILATTGGHVLGLVCVNKAGSAGSVTVDDAATATTPTVAVLDSTVARCSDFDVLLTTGLTIVTSGAPDVTVSWR